MKRGRESLCAATEGPSEPKGNYLGKLIAIIVISVVAGGGGVLLLLK